MTKPNAWEQWQNQLGDATPGLIIGLTMAKTHPEYAMALLQQSTEMVGELAPMVERDIARLVEQRPIRVEVPS